MICHCGHRKAQSEASPMPLRHGSPRISRLKLRGYLTLRQPPPQYMTDQ